MKEILYSDLDIKFLAHPMTGNVKTLSGKDVIKQSIKNLILTDQYDRFYSSNLYVNLNHSLFELMSEIEVISLKSRIEDIIRNHEPRATLIDVKVESRLDLNEIRISVYFQPQNAFSSEVVDIFLEKVR